MLGLGGRICGILRSAQCTNCCCWMNEISDLPCTVEMRHSQCQYSNAHMRSKAHSTASTGLAGAAHAVIRAVCYWAEAYRAVHGIGQVARKPSSAFGTKGSIP